MEDLERQSGPEEGQDGAEGADQGGADERSPENWKAELERKEAEYQERLRLKDIELEATRNAQRQPNANPLAGYGEQELEAYLAAPDTKPGDRVRINNELLDRRARKIAEAIRRDDDMRRSKQALEEEFPELGNPVHPLTIQTVRLLRQAGAEDTPATRRLAAKAAKAELLKGGEREKGREQERQRVEGIRERFSGEDRPKPGETIPGKEEQLIKQAIKGGNVVDEQAFEKIVRGRMVPANKSSLAG